MKQEHRLVAEVYRFLAPFVDTKCAVYLSLDGQAAITAHRAGRFLDTNIPDIWVTLIGTGSPVHIEAKTLDNDGKVMLMQSQLTAWRSTGCGAYKPQYWIGVDRPFERFYFWAHDDFLPILDRSKANRKTVTFRPPKSSRVFMSPQELALHVLRNVA